MQYIFSFNTPCSKSAGTQSFIIFLLLIVLFFMLTLYFLFLSPSKKYSSNASKRCERSMLVFPEWLQQTSRPKLNFAHRI